MEVNLKYLANLSNVSVSTVSRALRDDPRVKPETREEIKKLAARLNYVPNQTAQSLVTGKTKTIGLVLPNIRSFMHDVLDGIEKICTRTDINILLGVYNNDGEKELKELKLLLQKRVDGIILFHIGSKYDYQVTEMFRDIPTPLVLLDRKVAGGRFDVVLNDNFLGSSLLVEHAAKKGLDKIAFIYETEDVTTMQERTKGFIKALKEQGIVHRSEYLVTSPFHKIENGYESMKALCHLADPPQAVLASTGDNIIGIVKYMIEHPASIEKFCIAGFDDSEFLDLMRIPITRLDMCEQEIGRCSAELLMNRIDGYDGNSKEVVIPPVLIRR